MGTFRSLAVLLGCLQIKNLGVKLLSGSNGLLAARGLARADLGERFALVGQELIIQITLLCDCLLSLRWPDRQLGTVKFHLFIQSNFRGDDPGHFIIAHGLVQLLGSPIDVQILHLLAYGLLGRLDHRTLSSLRINCK